MARALIWFGLVGAMLVLSGCFHQQRYIYTKPAHPSVAAHSKHSYYTVRKGDSLYKIGRLFGISYRKLAKLNHLPYPYTIYVGQKIYLASPAPKRSAVHHKASKKRQVHHAKKSSKTAHKPQPTPRIHLRWPVKGVVTSRFGRRGSRMHDGIDIGAKDGTPVYAAADGTVVYSDSRLSGYGRLIIIRHSSRLFTAYAHNQKRLVNKGERVRAGQVIARVGHSGHATGPHLHFEVRLGTTPVDPLRYLPKR